MPSRRPSTSACHKERVIEHVTTLSPSLPLALSFSASLPLLCSGVVTTSFSSSVLFLQRLAHLRDSADITNSERGAGGGEGAEGGGFRRDREASFMSGDDGRAQGKGEAIGGSGR
jgi:hypothetical protein